jgi:DNA anti-recombination protein RmuC
MFSGELGSCVEVLTAIVGMAAAGWGIGALIVSFQDAVQSVQRVRLDFEQLSQELRQDLRQDAEQRRQEVRQDVEQLRQEMRQDAEQRRQEMRQEIQKNTDELKQIYSAAITGRITSIEDRVNAQQRSGWLR